jgi:hypothetical protein
VLPRLSAVDHNFVESLDKSGVVRRETRPPDWKAIEDLLGLFARAIQQLHTYPSSSPLCISAIDSCQRALGALDARDQVLIRVTPTELIVDDVATGRGTQVGHELARRLHKASVASVTFERAASARELGRFCEDLIRCGERHGSDMTLLEMATEHGIDRITIEMASRPEVLEVGTVPSAAADDLRRERTRFEAQLAKGGVVQHLYPPQKGWVRVDPGSAPSTMSLLDLAVLADDPATLASMLLRLTDEGEEIPPAQALQKKYSDVAMLISALDPSVARRMFGKLARAVLDLDPSSRQALLKRTVLPGLLDGRVDGTILRDFPDIDLAESLCLLLDLETAAPELLTTALSRLELPEDRHAAMVPLLDARLKEREHAAAAATDRQTTLTRHARDLVRVDAGREKQFGDFAAFDLALDSAATSSLQYIRSAVPASDIIGEQLTCLWHLVCLEPNPDAVSRFLERSFPLLAELERSARAGELPSWLASYRGLADRLGESRPDVSAVIAGALTAFCTPERADWIATLAADEPHGRQAAADVIQALGPAVVAPLVDLLDRDAVKARAIGPLLAEHAALLAPAVASLLDARSPGVLRTLLRVLGSAGPGYEETIAAYVSVRDEQIAREALRALARLGTPKAAALVVTEIERQRGVSSAAAEETLWHFPPAEAHRYTRELLGRRDFRMSHPDATERLLDRAARAGVSDLRPVLLELAPLRFRLWKPALARVARKAHEMLKAAPKA